MVKVTWEEMEKEYGSKSLLHKNRRHRSIQCQCTFNRLMENALNKISSQRILTIGAVANGYYTMEEIDCMWHEDMIENYAKTLDYIYSRFEIMDL